jgi:hypothetical protein
VAGPSAFRLARARSLGAVALANDTEYGLAGAVWTADAGRARSVAGRLRHGTVWINDLRPYPPQAEWGGFGKSGTGRELGPAGLAEYRDQEVRQGEEALPDVLVDPAVTERADRHGRGQAAGVQGGL